MKGSIVVSLRARGVYTYQFQKLLDIRAQVKRFFKQIVDIGCSAIVLLQLQSWTTWFSVLVMLFSIIFYINEDGHQISTTGGFWLAVCFIVVLPLLGLLGLTFHRREVALMQLAKVKALVVAFYAGYLDALPSAFSHFADDTRGQLLQFLDDFRLYLQHSRSYARHYTNPLLPNDPIPTAALFEVSQQLGTRLRTVQLHFGDLSRSCQHLQELGAPLPPVMHLRQCLLRLHTAFERISAIKEFRTPQAVRALLRFYVVVVVPVFTAPYWVFLGQETRSFAFATAFGLLMQLALVALLTAAVEGEDPFNEGALDTISVLEATDHCVAMLLDLGDSTGAPLPPPHAAPDRQRPRQRAGPPPNAAPLPRAHPITPHFYPGVQGSGLSQTTHLPMPPLPPLPTAGSNPLHANGGDPA